MHSSLTQYVDNGGVYPCHNYLGTLTLTFRPYRSLAHQTFNQTKERPNERFFIISSRWVWTRVYNFCSIITVFRIHIHCRNALRIICTRELWTQDADELALTDENSMRVRVAHNARLLSVEFEGRSNELPEVPPNAHPPPWSGKHSAKLSL